MPKENGALSAAGGAGSSGAKAPSEEVLDNLLDTIARNTITKENLELLLAGLASSKEFSEKLTQNNLALKALTSPFEKANTDIQVLAAQALSNITTGTDDWIDTLQEIIKPDMLNSLCDLLI